MNCEHCQLQGLGVCPANPAGPGTSPGRCPQCGLTHILGSRPEWARSATLALGSGVKEAAVLSAGSRRVWDLGRGQAAAAHAGASGLGPQKFWVLGHRKEVGNPRPLLGAQAISSPGVPSPTREPSLTLLQESREAWEPGPRPSAPCV